MTKQSELIGNHNEIDGMFSILGCHDTECTDKKTHRALSEKTKGCLLSVVPALLINHHLTPDNNERLVRKRDILCKYDFNKFAESIKIFPNDDKTRKGNLGEVFLTEYLSETTQITKHIYKLRFNSNVQQSMKGDDVLLLSLDKILLGESKFRAISNKASVDAVSENFSENLTLPLSISFVSARLYEFGRVEERNDILEIEERLIKGQIDVVNVGLILSDMKIAQRVETHMDSTNDHFIIISLGIETPNDFINHSYDLASIQILEGYEYDE